MGTRKNRHIEAVLTSTHNLCFEQKYEKYQNFVSENFQFLAVKFSIYLNRRVFVMFEKYVKIRVDGLKLILCVHKPIFLGTEVHIKVLVIL